MGKAAGAQGEIITQIHFWTQILNRSAAGLSQNLQNHRHAFGMGCSYRCGIRRSGSRISKFSICCFHDTGLRRF